MRVSKWAKHPKVLDWSDERGSGDPIMVTTAYGWAFEPDPDFCVAEHVRGFDNVAEFRRELSRIRPCSCLRCTSKGTEDRFD